PLPQAPVRRVHQRERADGARRARTGRHRAVWGGDRRVRQGGGRRPARAPPPYPAPGGHRRREGDRQGRLGAAAQGLGRRRRAPREDEGSRGGGARRGSRPRWRMTAPVPPPPAFGRFFLPGPTDVHPEVLAAMQRPMIGHRSGAMEQLLVDLEAPLARLFRTSRPVMVGTASATGFMEMAVRNGVRHRALSLAGSPVETDGWQLDFVLTGSQKALALPPGLALGAASVRMLERAKTLPGRGLYFDLVSFLEATTKHQPTNTPAISLFFALEAQLARIERAGGAEARWRRHDAMR